MEKTTAIFEVKDFEFKELDESTGQFSGIASITSIEDLGGDIMEDGCFEKSIKDKPVIPVLLQHDSREVIGEGTVEMDGQKLMLKGQLDMDDPVAVRTLGKLRKKLLKGLSIGFQAIRVTWEETKERYIRHVTEAKLWEVSVVTFPMLPAAQVTAVKSLPDDHEIHAAICELKAGRKISAATRTKIESALKELQALLDDAGDDSTSEDDAKGAPEVFPPALLDRIAEMRSMIAKIQ
jgi:hypothetical protein